MATSYDVADMFLDALKAPKTPAMRRAVAIWLKFESGNNITGNNPWNLHSGDACPASQGFCPGNGSLPGQIGNRYAGPGDKNVAVFATLNDGVRANAANLGRVQGAGYDRVISQAQAGNAFGFLSAIQQSKWSANHYGFIKLTSAFNGANSYNGTLKLNPVGGSPGKNADDSVLPISLGGFADLVKFPVGHIITSDDITAISNTLDRAGWFGTTPGLIQVKKVAFEEFMKANALDKAWNKDLQNKLAGQALTDAGNIGSATDPLGGVGDAITGVATTFTIVAFYIIAFALVVVGLFIYSKSTSQPAEGAA